MLFRSTREERTPVAPASRTSGKLWIDVLSGLEWVCHVDALGRPWAFMVERLGFTRVDGVWSCGYLDLDNRGFRPALRPTPEPWVAAALDRWELATLHVDRDPTPAGGIPRPFSSLVGAR